jgi:hypothetical protein
MSNPNSSADGLAVGSLYLLRKNRRQDRRRYQNTTAVETATG